MESLSQMWTLTVAFGCLTLTVSGCGGDKNTTPLDTAAARKSAAVTTALKIAGEATEPDTPEPAAVATFGNGCYWCTEAVFQELDGVESVVAGFCGGDSTDVTYEEVCRGDTGHAEVVQIRYDPKKISYAELLEAFFLTHDPTTLNRQGADVGTQYRSVIFYHDDAQQQLATRAIEELTRGGVYSDPIVTEVAPYANFIAADEYHQDYFDKNPQDRYCLYNIPQKLDKIRKVFKDKLKAR